MALLRFQYAEKIDIILSDISLSFIRGESATQSNVAINYANGTGQTIAMGQVIYTAGTIDTPNYLRIVSEDIYSLTGSGSFEVSVTHYPSSTQAAQTVNYTFDGTVANINLDYNSKPVASDVVIAKANREPHVFAPTDFTYSDYDGDVMASIAIYGTVTGYTLDGIPYVAGTWVTVDELLDDKLVYTPLDQDAYYEKDNTYKVQDINGYISA